MSDLLEELRRKTEKALTREGMMKRMHDEAIAACRAAAARGEWEAKLLDLQLEDFEGAPSKRLESLKGDIAELVEQLKDEGLMVFIQRPSSIKPHELIASWAKEKPRRIKFEKVQPIKVVKVPISRLPRP